jgi:hypothetical protein
MIELVVFEVVGRTLKAPGEEESKLAERIRYMVRAGGEPCSDDEDSDEDDDTDDDTDGVTCGSGNKGQDVAVMRGALPLMVEDADQ